MKKILQIQLLCLVVIATVLLCSGCEETECDDGNIIDNRMGVLKIAGKDKNNATYTATLSGRELANPDFGTCMPEDYCSGVEIVFEYSKTDFESNFSSTEFDDYTVITTEGDKTFLGFDKKRFFYVDDNRCRTRKAPGQYCETNQQCEPVVNDETLTAVCLNDPETKKTYSAMYPENTGWLQNYCTYIGCSTPNDTYTEEQMGEAYYAGNCPTFKTAVPTSNSVEQIKGEMFCGINSEKNICFKLPEDRELSDYDGPAKTPDEEVPDEEIPDEDVPVQEDLTCLLESCATHDDCPCDASICMPEEMPFGDMKKVCVTRDCTVGDDTTCPEGMSCVEIPEFARDMVNGAETLCYK